MKIVHVCLSNFFIDDYSYQENELVRRNLIDGHTVTVLASIETHDESRKLAYVEPSTYVNADGAKVVRVPYRAWLPLRLARKLRTHPRIFELLERESPDLVVFHGTCGWEIRTVAEYARRHPEVRLFVDSHEDKYNSARTFLSHHLLHRSYYRPILLSTLDVVNVILCVSLETMDFVESMYGVPRERLEFYPLGGRVLEDEEYECRRSRKRVELGVSDDAVLMVQTGRMDSRKRPIATIEAFRDVSEGECQLVFAGSVDPAIAAEFHTKIGEDSRISYIGWMDSESLLDLLCAADVYLQPGTQSATMQMSLCARCAVVLDAVPSHEPYVRGNGWLLQDRSFASILQEAASAPDSLRRYAEQSLRIARELLDYRTLAARITDKPPSPIPTPDSRGRQ